MTTVAFVTKRILDLETGIEYATEYRAGKALGYLVGARRTDTWAWFKLIRQFADRFRTRNADGDWVRLDDPSAPLGKLRNR